jgi:hypothetical protein
MVVLLVSARLCPDFAVADATGACQGDSYFCDSWKWTDPSVPSAQAVLTTVTLYSAGEYRGGPLPPELGGPNGLGANAFELNNETLSFVYRKAGRTRVDDMLRGRVHKDGDMKFQFTVTGGYYGQSLTGKIFVFERIP